MLKLPVLERRRRRSSKWRNMTCRPSQLGLMAHGRLGYTFHCTRGPHPLPHWLAGHCIFHELSYCISFSFFFPVLLLFFCPRVYYMQTQTASLTFLICAITSCNFHSILWFFFPSSFPMFLSFWSHLIPVFVIKMLSTFTDKLTFFWSKRKRKGEGMMN